MRTALPARTVVLAAGLAAALCVPLAHAADPPAKAAEEVPAIQLPTDPKAKKKLEAAQDYLKEEAWAEAGKLLQSLLDETEDKFVSMGRKDADGKETVVLTSARTEANRLVGTMPEKGLEHYRLTYGPTAAELLKQAKAKDDAAGLAQVAQRYLWTEAGAEATQLLARRYLDAGEFAAASLSYERLLERQSLAEWAPETLFHASRAFLLGGDKAGAEKTWKQLGVRVGTEKLRIGDRSQTLEEWRKELDKEGAERKERKPPADSPVYRGDPGRSGQGQGGAPFLEKHWQAATTKEESTRGLLASAVRLLEIRNQPVLPSFFPIVADGKVVYRSHGGIHVREVKTGQERWYADSRLSLDYMSGTPGENNKFNLLYTWAQPYFGQGKAGMLLENSTVGTLSTDGIRVYAVEDLPIPPYPATVAAEAPPWGSGKAPTFGALNAAVYNNTLVAYDLKLGKLWWELGGKAAKDDDKKDGTDLAGSLFLGPPLPLGDRVYALNQKDQDLRLLCIDPGRSPTVVWAQTLVTTRNNLLLDGHRRVQAAHLAYGEGILVCPTNAGAVLGVDLLTQNIVWAYSYREKDEIDPARDDMIRRGIIPPPPGWNPNARPNRFEWKVTAPVIVAGKVVFTAPDAAGVCCLRLRDGALLWKVNREDDDLYFAGAFKDKVLIVGKKSCRALDLADGKVQWRVETGTPSGQGGAADGVYYLPLKSASRTEDKGPAVCAIDIDKGVVVGHARSRKKADGAQVVPGNLVFVESEVLSQTLDEIAAFPVLKVKLQQMDALLAKDPKDSVGLVERAELKFDKGDLQDAVDDLRAALANKPPAAVRPRAEGKLYEALTEYLQRDFDKAEKYLDEYKALCDIEIPRNADAAERQKVLKEGLRRHTVLLFVTGQGRERQGKLVEALDSYLELAGLPGNEMMAAPDDPNVQMARDVWIAGRIAGMVKRATPEQRKQLEAEINRKYKALQPKDKGPG